jgi:uncharacterized coiled-coil protein SlyX
VDGAIPAIVTQDEFDSVRSKMSGRAVSINKPSKSKLLFTRKLLCAYCGLSLRAVKRTHDVKYRCATVDFTGEYGCQKDWIMEDDVKKAVLAALKQQIAFADEARILLEARTAEATPTIEKLRKEIERLKKSMEKARTAKITLWERYHKSEISGEAFQRENEKADELVKTSEGKVADIERRILDMEMSTGQENTFIERFSKQVGITELTRPIVEELISEIKVYSPERIEIVFNYADEYAKILELTSVDGKKRKKAK